MRGNNTILINGRQYDTATGLPVESTDVHVAKETAKAEAPVAAHHVVREQPKPHVAKPHRSTTLRREYVKKPAAARDTLVGQRRDHIHVAKSPAISKFAPHPVIERSHAKPEVQSVVVSTAHQRVVATRAQATPVARSSRELKDHLIASKLAAATPNTTKPKRTPRSASVRISSVMAACCAVIVLGGYISYINMPNLSVRVAAAQSGVHADYPGYVPSGYRFDGPVAYSNGQVKLQFAAVGGTTNYEIIQQNSSWDSQALLDNYVAAKSTEYTINDSQGLTIYTYQNNAAWVNHGVFYTINGNAPLRTDQVLKIANSL